MILITITFIFFEELCKIKIEINAFKLRLITGAVKIVVDYNRWR